MEDMTGASGSSGTPSTVEKSPLDFSNEDPPLLITERIRTEEQGHDELSQGISPGIPPDTDVAPEPDLEKETVSMGSLVNKTCRKRGPNEAKANAPPKVLRKDHVASHLSQSTLRGKSLASIGIGMGSTVSAPATQETPVHVEGVSDPDSLSHAKLPPALEQDIAQSSKKAVATKDHDSKKSTSFTSMVGSPGSIYQPRWGVTNNCRLDTLAPCQDTVDHIVPPGYFSELRHLPNDEFLNQYNTTLAQQVAMGSQLSNHQLSQQVSTLQAQVTGEERIKATFEEFKKYEDDRVFTDVVSAGIAKGMSERLKHGVEYKKSKVDLAAIKEYEPEVDTKYVVALHVLKDLKYHLVDQLEKLKDALIDVIMSSLYLESDSGEDTPQWIRELHPSSSQLKTPVYPEVRNPKDPWSFKEEILLEDAIAANISHTKKKKSCWVVCRTHEVGSTHHARSDGVPVSVPTVAPQAGSKDRPPMLAPGNYIQWKSRIKCYIDTKPNRELIHYCLENPPYELGWKDKFIIDAEGNPTTATHQVFETF
uniref:Uncharacterized protein n=1 Tax=Tanacetum cinerariifolium TaxID=118510 RepID=A0A6L2KP75_TANCI|nr:hypothetical protein [Tanacetum cinerariifolium]